MNLTLKVATVLQNSDHQTLLLRETYDTRYGEKWNLIKGTYDNAFETIEECAFREVREEVSLIPESLRLWKVLHYGDRDNPRILHVFRATILGTPEISFQGHQANESISDARWLSAEEMNQITPEECMGEYIYMVLQR